MSDILYPPLCNSCLVKFLAGKSLPFSTRLGQALAMQICCNLIAVLCASGRFRGK